MGCHLIRDHPRHPRKIPALRMVPRSDTEQLAKRAA
jgi:hypothetical protein